MKRKWDVSSKEVRQKCTGEILARLDEQEDSQFGVIAAEDIMDIVAQNIGPDIYNLAIKDTRKLLETRLADIETDLELLEHRG